MLTFFIILNKKFVIQRYKKTTENKMRIEHSSSSKREVSYASQFRFMLNFILFNYSAN